MKVATIVGARPQFIKAAPVSLALRRHHREVIIHTGQHYDVNMSGQFFTELAIPTPDHQLKAENGPHGRQTGSMLGAVESVLTAERPDLVLVYGDTNSTLAGALAAAKLNIPVAHVEAGLRSYRRSMPEEINRVVVDHLSRWLFAPTERARDLLSLEGITNGVEVVGDVMIDALELIKDKIGRCDTVARLGLVRGRYYLATVHRAENVDDDSHLSKILQGFAAVSSTIVFPVHPRTRARLHAIEIPDNVLQLPPQGYLDTLALLDGSRALLTDSGGMQKEAYSLGVPCVTLRDETEWPETVAAGWNFLAGTSVERIFEGSLRDPRGLPRPSVFGDGHAAERIVKTIGLDFHSTPSRFSHD
jgi:UDP-GlcNAc3NAcA epimerase